MAHTGESRVCNKENGDEIDLYYYQCNSSEKVNMIIRDDGFTFPILPSELKAHILTYLPLNEIINFATVSRSNYKLIAPCLSDSIGVEENADEYSIDTWIEMVNRLKGSRMEKVETLEDCKKLFLKTLLEQRSCRYCKKGTLNLKTFLKGEIVKSCYCDGYICRKPCWNAERLAHESVAKCSKCGYKYQFTKTEKVGTIAKNFSQFPISSQLFLTTVTYFSCLSFVYLLIAIVGNLPFNSNSKIWIKLENFWYFKNVPMWNSFVNGMSIMSFITMSILLITVIIASLFGGANMWGLRVDLGAVELLLLIGTIIFVVFTPFILGKEFKKVVLRKAIYDCPVKTPEKYKLES